MKTLPASNAFSDFGSAKTDYSAVVNSATDWSADNINTCTAAVSCMSRTIDRVYLNFTTATSSGALVLNTWDAVWKASTVTLPVLARSGTGVFTITFPATVSDPLGNAGIIVNLTDARAGICSATTFGFVNVVVTSANLLTVYTANSGASANDLTGTSISVWAKGS